MNDNPSIPESVLQPFAPMATESPEAFEAFLCYFELGQNRSLKKTAELLGISQNTVEEWSSRHAWRQRIRDYRAKLIIERLQNKPHPTEAIIQAQVAHELALHSALNSLGHRLLQTSQNLFQHQLVNNAVRIDMGQVLRMMQLAEKLLSSTRALSPPDAKTAHPAETTESIQPPPA